MCYSAMVKQDVKELGMSFHARIDYDLILEMLERRMKDDSIKLTKAFEASFANPENKKEEAINRLILDYRKFKISELESEAFKQKKRLAEAERVLKIKETKKALEDKRISSNKIEWVLKKIGDLKRDRLVSADSRIFPMTFAPIVLFENGEAVIKLARYHCRPNGKSASIDRALNGLYNARRDNLGNQIWKNLFGKKHAFFVVESFYENVAKSDYQNKKLKEGEKDENLVLHFTPDNGEMYVACLYDSWDDKGKDIFYSFAALTGDPTPEIAETGHERLIIALKPENIEEWLRPEGQPLEALYAILDDAESLKYAHELAG